jgi:tetratricopeptide (TPR) repeat protein
MIAPAALAALLAFSPFTKEEENVREGNEQLLAGDPEGALLRYDAAERAVGDRAELDFDRAHAALRLGRAEEAHARLRRAAERGSPGLASRALQNLGHTLAGAGDREGALTAYADALRKDPTNEDARHDLEVLLRRKAEERPPQTPGGGQREEPKGGGGEERPDPKQGQQAAPDRPSPSENPGQAGKPDASPGPPPGEAPSPASASRERTRQDAEQLLDALRARERKLPLAGRERTGSRRDDAAKDW